MLFIHAHSLHPCFAGKVLFEKVAELVPRHPGRTKKPAAPASIKQAPGVGAGPSGAPTASKQSGKGGKKKRK